MSYRSCLGSAFIICHVTVGKGNDLSEATKGKYCDARLYCQRFTRVLILNVCTPKNMADEVVHPMLDSPIMYHGSGYLVYPGMPIINRLFPSPSGHGL
jgi:hypothetical protein